MEGLAELIRYNSDLSHDNRLGPENFSFGQQLMQNFDNDQINIILDNSNLVVDGMAISVFDLTEEKNSAEAVSVLKKILN